MLVAERDDLVRARDRLERPGHRLDAGGRGGAAGRDLVAHDLDRVRRRPDPSDVAIGDGAGEVGVLGEEPVAGVHGLGAAARDHVDDGVGVQVALGGALTAEGVGLVCVGNMQGRAIRVGIDGDAADAELAEGAKDPDGDLPAIRDEDFLEHTPYSPDG